jgi:NADH-quinone oxidoreductase subunit N
LIYINCGTLFFDDILKINNFDDSLDVWALFFIFIALLFKIGSFPFHQWLCDVYEGVLITITAFFSIVPKSILFALVLRLSFTFFSDFLNQSELLIVSSGLASIVFASIAALYQKRLKRLLAYSAISHSGFVLVAISCNSIDSIKATLIYILIYLIMSIALFSTVFLVVRSNKLPKFLINWSFFAVQNVCIGLTFSCILFSIAGIPPLAGFFSKLGVFSCLLFNGFTIVPVIIAISSSIACFYYIRLIRIFFFVENNRSIFWTGSTFNITPVVISCFTIFTVFCLARPNLLVSFSTFVSLSLV